MKPANQLKEWDADIRSRVEGSAYSQTRTLLNDAAMLLEDCERDIERLLSECGFNSSSRAYGEPEWTNEVRFTLARLRGNA